MKVLERARLVGVNTNANMPYGSCESLCKIGRANAIVFPWPVLAFPMQSRPIDIIGLIFCSAQIRATRTS